MLNPDPQFFYQKELTMDCGSCPYQIAGKFWLEGTGDIYFFFLRARWNEISFDVYATPEELEDLKISTLYNDSLFFRKEDEYRAGYITQQQAHHLMDFFILAFYQSKHDKAGQ
ncbi:hypothetical protein ACTHGU_05920 [Chitinophagaceae bacterium MMS25-I14]